MFRRRKSTPEIGWKKSKKSKKPKKLKNESRKRSGTVKKNKDKNKEIRSLGSSSSFNPTHCDNLRESSESSYVIQANLENDILTMTVHHTLRSREWRQEFTQNSFKSNSIHQVAKLLINSIQETANNHNNHDNDNNDIKIFEYNGFCYVTLLYSNLPSFALRPIQYTLNEAPPLNGIITQNMINKTRKQWNNRRLRYSTGNIVCSKQQYQQDPVYHNTNKLTITLNGNYLTSTPKQKTSYNDNNNNNNNTLSPSQDTVTTMDYNHINNNKNNDDDAFIDGDYYKHKTMANKSNIKYGFV